MNRIEKILRRQAVTTAVLLALAGAAHGQISTSTIKGQVTGTTGTSIETGLTVTAVNRANGNTYRTTTLANGSYVLTGLAPGDYEIRITAAGGTVKTEVVTVRVGETATLNLALAGSVTKLDTITVTSSSQRQGVRDSQVGTSVSQN
jgi:Carboxypeptidase regulatory-like domain